jgi:hypothetical protein
MSPTRKPSSVAGLRRAIAAPGRYDYQITGEPAPPAIPAPKPARVTLNLPPELYRQLARWCDSAAVAVDSPRVSIQDALRTMIRTTLRETAVTGAMLDDLRAQR